MQGLSKRNFCDVHEMKYPTIINWRWDAASCCASEQLLRKASSLSLCVFSLLYVCNYRRFYTSFYFIITNFCTKLKPEAKVSRGMDTLTLPHTQRLSDHRRLVSHTALISFSENWSRIVSLRGFVDFAKVLFRLIHQRLNQPKLFGATFWNWGG